jgi:hypothetical protein
MVNKLIELFDQYGLKKKIITYVGEIWILWQLPWNLLWGVKS